MKTLSSFRSSLRRLLPLAIGIGSLVISAPPAFASWDDFADRVRTNVSRIRNTKVAGGDYDDKREEVQMRIKMINESTKEAFPKHRGLIFVISESMEIRNEYKVVIREEFPIDLDPREELEFLTAKKIEGWDNTGAIWGYKYEGYCLLVLDEAGEIVFEHASPSKVAGFAKTYKEAKEGDLVDKSMKTIGKASSYNIR